MKYWIYMNSEVPGSFTPAELSVMPGFGATTLVCPAEGEILEKNWRHAGEFSDIVSVLKPSTPLPAPPPPPMEEPVSTSTDVDKLLDSSSNRLFRHVTELMKELESRREERSLNMSLQRQLADLKEQLQKSRERTAMLENRMGGIVEMEETARKYQAHIQSLEAALKAAENNQADLRVKLETTKMEFDNIKRELKDSTNDLAIRNRLVDKLSRELTEKELTLAKSLAVIRRFEEDLGRICPDKSAPEARHPSSDSQDPPPGPGGRSASKDAGGGAPGESPDESATEAKASASQSSASEPPPSTPPRLYTTDNPPLAPPPLEPRQPAAQGALVNFMKKILTPEA